MRYRVGTRGSKLALAQTKQVIEKLKSAFPEDEFDVVIIKTTGDMDQKSRLDQIGSKGIFDRQDSAQQQHPSPQADRGCACLRNNY